jgi:diguanylate cyclase (GGDEF)-like protein/PAS domain S-box-containing protein
MISALLSTFAIVIILTALAIFVAVRAGDTLAAQLFVAVTGALILLNVLNLARMLVTDPLTGARLAAPALLTLTLLELLLLLLLSALFMPQWWAGRRPIRWISIPYLLVLAALGVDVAAGTGWFVGDMARNASGFYRFEAVQPGAGVMLALSLVGWLVQLALLLVAFVRQPAMRPTLGMLAGSLAVGIALPVVLSPFHALAHLAHVLVSLPMLLTLAYAVLRTRLLIPTPAALNLAIRAMGDPLAVLDTRQRIVYANPAAEGLHIRPGPLPPILAAWMAAPVRDDTVPAAPLALDGRQIIFRATEVANAYGKQIGTLLLGRDVTELEQRTAELHKSEQLLQTLIDHIPASIMVKDIHQRYILINAVHKQMFPPVARDKIIGLSDGELLEHLHQHRAVQDEEHLQLMQRQVAQWQQEDKLVLATGSTFAHEVVMPAHDSLRSFLTRKFPLYDEQSTLMGIGFIALDITERKQAEEALRESEAQLQAIFNNTLIGVGLMDTQWNYLRINNRWAEMLGYSLEEVYAGNALLVTHPDDVEVSRHYQQRLAAGLIDSYRLEKRFVRRDGATFWGDVQVSLVRNRQGAPSLIIGTVADISERKQMELQLQRINERLQQQATRDALTGLHNRRYLDETLPRELQRAASHRQSVGIMMLDIDHFKRCNDTYGHDAGDTLLRTIGTFLYEHIRDTDMVCRYGGEEFTVVLPGALLEDTRQRAEQIRRGVQSLTVQHQGQPLDAITMSLGVAVFPDHGATADDMMRAADQALYQAKHSGRNQVVVFDLHVGACLV